MKPHTLYTLIMAVSTISLILACNTLVPANVTPSPLASTATAESTTTLVPTQEPSLSSVSIAEDSQAPAYQIHAEIPTLQGSTNASVVNFNTAMTSLVQGEIEQFKKGVAELPADTPASGSSFDVTYTLMLQRTGLWGFKFDFSGYSAGAAHPYHYSKIVNYDLGLGRPLDLGELFLPGSDYLSRLAEYCTAELSQRDIAFEGFSDGAAPTPENYRNWNITPDGLLITFDEYQVAPYAAGPQMVTVPYSVLQTIVNPQGPLATLIP
jgi:hypothetical protein